MSWRTYRFWDENDGQDLSGREIRWRERCRFLQIQQPIDNNSIETKQPPLDLAIRSFIVKYSNLFVLKNRSL